MCTPGLNSREGSAGYRREPDALHAASVRIVAAATEKRRAVLHLNDLADRGGLVGCRVVVRLADAIADEISEIARSIDRRRSLVVQPTAHVLTVHLGLEIRPEGRFARERPRVDPAVDDSAGNELAEQIGAPLGDRLLEQRAGASTKAARDRLLNVNGLVGDDEFQAVGRMDVALLKGAKLVERRRRIDRIEFAADEQT